MSAAVEQQKKNTDIYTWQETGSIEESQQSNMIEKKIHLFKDGAYYCYCAYVLRISRYSDFLSPVLTNTWIFLRGLRLSGESRS